MRRKKNHKHLNAWLFVHIAAAPFPFKFFLWHQLCVNEQKRNRASAKRTHALNNFCLTPLMFTFNYHAVDHGRWKV